MAIELNGTTGITTPDITSEAGLTVDGVSFASGAPANTLVTTSGGNVGIGTSSPSNKLDVNGNSGFLGGAKLRLYNATNGNFASIYNNATGSGNVLSFGTNSLDQMVLDVSGNLLVGTTSPGSGNSARVLARQTSSGGYAVVADAVLNGATYYLIGFQINGTTVVGQITSNGTSTSYLTSSDYRLKENVVGVTGASARVQQLNPVRFNFIADPDRTVDGFLAHEVQDVVPEAITGTKDATEMVDVHDEDGNVTGQEERPVYQGIDQSKLVPLLTAALQEALTKIETLEARVAALEAAQ